MGISYESTVSRVLRLSALAGLALGCFGCDEATKSLAKVSLDRGGAVDLVPGAVELRYVENTDIAFNAFSRAGVAHSPWLLAALAVVAIVGCLTFGLTVRAWTGRVAIALIVGGALGNLVDRLARGYVVDFIHIFGWPVFNVADIAVCVGVPLLALSLYRQRHRERVPSPP
jgi:signal peptidase II